MDPRRVLDTKTYWLTDRQLQYDLDLDLLQLLWELLQLCHCELWLLEAGRLGQGQFGNLEEGEHLPSEAGLPSNG
jgi:hypothetical protein